MVNDLGERNIGLDDRIEKCVLGTEDSKNDSNEF